MVSLFLTPLPLQQYEDFSLRGKILLFYTWSIISISKQEKNFRYRLGDAAILRDGNPEFLRNFALWLMEWNVEKITNSERFTMTSYTSDALHRTLLCHAALIEDLLSEGYRYVLTSRFQSVPLRGDTDNIDKWVEGDSSLLWRMWKFQKKIENQEHEWTRYYFCI